MCLHVYEASKRPAVLATEDVRSTRDRLSVRLPIVQTSEDVRLEEIARRLQAQATFAVCRSWITEDVESVRELGLQPFAEDSPDVLGHGPEDQRPADAMDAVCIVAMSPRESLMALTPYRIAPSAGEYDAEIGET